MSEHSGGLTEMQGVGRVVLIIGLVVFLIGMIGLFVMYTNQKSLVLMPMLNSPLLPGKLAM